MTNAWQIVIAAVGVCLICGPAACSAENVEQSSPTVVNFAHRFESGITLQYVHTLRAQDTSTIPNAGIFATNATVIRTFSLHILEVKDDGSADVRIALDRFELNITRNSSKLISFDTQTNTEPGSAVERSLQALATISINATVDSSGGIVQMESVSQTLPAGTTIPPRAVAFYQDEWFRTAITTVLKTPAESQSIAVGDTWDTTLDSVVEGSTIARTTHSHELVAADEHSALIQGTGVAQLQFDPSESNDIQGVRITDQALSFSITWNMSLGALEAYETEQFLQFEIERTGLTTTSERRSQTSLRRIQNPAASDTLSGTT